MKKDTQITKEGTLPVKVSKEVVSHLSLGLYRNFARAVKELISNSYDADATEVKIKLDLDNARIVVKDNGRGMDISELEDKFLTIGYPTPLDEKVDELGRKRIGTFGIGCLSVFPYCSSMKVITKKKDENKIIELLINTEQFFKRGTFFFIEEAEVPYRIYPSDLPKERGETIIVLEKIKPHIVKDLRQKKPARSSIEKFGSFRKFKWMLSQYAPIQFPPDRKDLRRFFEDQKTVPMRLWLGGEELFRNVPEKAQILEKGEEKFGNISIKYVIMTPKKPIQTEEARGLQIRLRDVAIGLPTDFEVVKFKGKVLGKLNWICGEVHISEGLSSALMIDRDSFYYTQEVANIHEFFRQKLIKWNETLEKWASEDKDIYESLIELGAPNRVIKELKSEGIIHFSKERLRLLKAPIAKRKRISISSLSEKVGKALSEKKDYKIIHEKGKVPKRKPPVKVIPKKKSIVVYDGHPSFAETIKVGKKKFSVGYDEWDPGETPYSICKLHDTQNKVTFNTSHPLFKSKLSDEIIKQLSLGIVLILKRRKDKEKLLVQLNHLLEEAFLG
jgi:hypothetical protein